MTARDCSLMARESARSVQRYRALGHLAPWR